MGPWLGGPRMCWKLDGREDGRGATHLLTGEAKGKVPGVGQEGSGLVGPRAPSSAVVPAQPTPLLMPEGTTPLLRRRTASLVRGCGPHLLSPREEEGCQNRWGRPRRTPGVPGGRVCQARSGGSLARTGHSGVINVHRGHTSAVCPGDSWPVRSGGSPHNRGLPGLSGQEPRAGGDQARGDGRQHHSPRPLRGSGRTHGARRPSRSQLKDDRRDPSRSPARSQSFPRNRARPGAPCPLGSSPAG